VALLQELCGGTHVHKIVTSVLKIVSEESVAAGVRRIEAITGIGAPRTFPETGGNPLEAPTALNVGEDAVLAHVEKLSQTVKQLEKQLGEQKRKAPSPQLDDLASAAHSIKGVKVVVKEVENIDRDGLRQLVDSLRQKLGSGVVVWHAGQRQSSPDRRVTKDLTLKSMLAS